VSGRDRRVLVIVGPCSLHCEESAVSYAERLASLQRQCESECLLVMRAYIEKPRTNVGWKGMLYDPDLSGSHNLEKGIRMSRHLMIRLLETGVPLATEALSPLAHHYLDDLVSWVAIGARTTESQVHREMASSLPCAVGFKNGTDGHLGGAVNAIKAAGSGHTYLGMDRNGRVGVCTSAGNASTQLVLRGGKSGSNYDADSVASACQSLAAAGLNPGIVIDCSHENSGKDHTKQAVALSAVAEQIASGQDAIRGVMLESHLESGQQAISGPLKYGVSITDACIGWEETESLIDTLCRAKAVSLPAQQAC